MSEKAGRISPNDAYPCIGTALALAPSDVCCDGTTGAIGVISDSKHPVRRTTRSSQMKPSKLLKRQSYAFFC